jgi:hypothetical protein
MRLSYPRGFGGKFLEQSFPLRPISANAFAPVLDVGRIEEVVVAPHFFHTHGRHLISRPRRMQRICGRVTTLRDTETGSEGAEV